MSFQHIQTIEVDETATMEEFSIRGRTLITPSCFLGIKSNENRRIDIDINVAMRALEDSSSPESLGGIYFPLEYYERIRSKMTPEQRLFLQTPPVNQNFFLVPSVETLYSGIPPKMQNLLREDVFRRNYKGIINYFSLYENYSRSHRGRRASQQSFTNWIRGATAGLRNQAWDFLRYQHNANALFLIPPTPPIFDFATGIDLAETVFGYAREFLDGIIVENSNPRNLEPIALFLPISIGIFKNIAEVQGSLDRITRLLNDIEPDIIVVKFFDETTYFSHVNDHIIGIRYFMDCISNYCRNNEKLSVIIDSRKIGKVLQFRGHHIHGYPVNRKSTMISQGGPITGPPPREEWPVIDPETRDEVPFDNLVQRVKANNRGHQGNANALPYLGDISNRYNQYTIQHHLSQTEQTEFAKMEEITLLLNDVKQLREAIVNHDIRAIIGRFQRGTGLYASLIRLLLNE